MKYCGIDLHSNNCLIVVLDDRDKVLLGQRVQNDLAGILKLLCPYRRELAEVVVEATYNWYWLVDGLMAAGYEVKLAYPSAIKKYDGLKHRGDQADARYLAHLLRLGILPTGTVCHTRPSKKAHAVGEEPYASYSGRGEHHGT